ncbi:ATP synthase F1 subunit gamma [Candidatus Kuenenbacteria bacterium]|nr:ATP synthase F1 subunit gamma [Candidatus Kuenenbacteria bacterium]
MNSKEIQRRIKGVKNTKQITKAMEMVAASKMRKATERVLATRSYARLAWEMLNNLSGRVNPELHPLFQEREIKKIAVILITSDRGLCGAMNTQVIQKAIKTIEKQEKSKVEFISVGKKGRDFIKKYYKIFAEFIGLENVSKIAEIAPIVKIAIEDYEKGLYDKVILIYTDFISTLKQEPIARQLLPLKKEEFKKILDEIDHLEQVQQSISKSQEAENKNLKIKFEYKFEPNSDEVLKELLPRLLEIQIYQALLESNASEHCARMVAMKNATDAAKDLIDNLTMTFNQVRQASITQEIAEISTGAAFSL